MGAELRVDQLFLMLLTVVTKSMFFHLSNNKILGLGKRILNYIWYGQNIFDNQEKTKIMMTPAAVVPGEDLLPDSYLRPF